MQAKRKTLFGLLITLAFGVHTVSAQPTSHKEIHGLPTTLAIAQFIDGRFLLVGLNGRVQQFDLRPDDFFTLAHFSPDGRLIVGLTERTITVLNQRFERVWQRNAGAPNVTSMALSPDGTKVAILENDLRSRTAHVEVVAAEGPNEVVDIVALADPDAQARGVSWDSKGERITFGAAGEIRIVDVNSKTSVMAAAGYDPSWSPDGQWIAYRSTERQLILLDMNTRASQSTDLRVSSGAHWSPDSKYLFIDEDYSAKGPTTGCMTNSRFVIYRLSDKARKNIYDPCGIRDANFGWVSDAVEWRHAASAKASSGAQMNTGDKGTLLTPP